MQYNPIADIIKSWALGVKVSFTIDDSSGVSKPSNSRSSQYSSKWFQGQKLLIENFIPEQCEKTGKIDNKNISLTGSTSL